MVRKARWEENYYFSTPMVNPHCPFGLPNPLVMVTDKEQFDKTQILHEDSRLNTWMANNGFGELMSNIYQADHPELKTPETVQQFLESMGMQHNPALDQMLIEFTEEDL